MPIFASAPPSTPAPAGLHRAVCTFVEDVGIEYSEMFDKEDPKVIIGWEIEELRTDGKPFMMSRRYTLSLGKKANLRRDLESWRGRKFTATELERFDVEVLLGKPCLLNITHETRDSGEIRAVISAITPMMKGMEPLTPVATEAPPWVDEVRKKNAQVMAARVRHAPGAGGFDGDPQIDDPNDVPF